MSEPQAAASSPQLLAQVGQVMDEAGVRWCAIGALTVAYHGWVRASMDADALVTMRDSKVNSEQLVALLRNQGWEVEFRDGDMGGSDRIRHPDSGWTAEQGEPDWGHPETGSRVF